MSLILLGVAVVVTAQSVLCAASAAAVDTRVFFNNGGCNSQSSAVTVPVGGQSTFSSPSYPRNYGAFAGCTWSFRTSGNAELRLLCPEVHLSVLASVTVWDGSNSRRYKCAFCSGPFSIDQTLNSQELRVQFSNPFLFTAKGFSCVVTANAPDTTCKCGVSDVRRIVGGTSALQGEYPWMAGVVNRGEDASFCGGVLISSQYVLTAAHCTQNPESLSLDVRLGVLNESSSPPTEVRRQVLEIINHNLYDDTTYDYDISLLRIEEVDFTSSSVRPVCLPLAGAGNLDGQSVEVAGWGSLSALGSFPDSLLKVTVPVVSNRDCEALLAPAVTITDRMFCAGETGKDSCQGDSGGPAMLRVGTHYELVGVVSFGRGCGQADTPGVYTRVAALLQWIEQNSPSGVTCPRP